jgi:hypothetical protein
MGEGIYLSVMDIYFWFDGAKLLINGKNQPCFKTSGAHYGVFIHENLLHTLTFYYALW